MFNLIALLENANECKKITIDNKMQLDALHLYEAEGFVCFKNDNRAEEGLKRVEMGRVTWHNSSETLAVHLKVQPLVPVRPSPGQTFNKNANVCLISRIVHEC